MTRDATIKRIVETGIIPIIRVPSSDDALRIVDAIKAAGIDIIEITMTVPGAIEIMRDLGARYGDELVLGAGTVLEAETARLCMLAGAKFVVSPIVDEGMLTCCRTHGVVALPGALTPTEVVRAWRAGGDMVKVFPCGAVGGASYIRALKAPLPQIALVPTGGVSLETIGDFFKAGAAAVGAGADIVDLSKIREGRGDAITERARRYVEAVRKARGA